MAIDTTYDEEQANALPHLTLINDSVLGSPYVKMKGEIYLPNRADPLDPNKDGIYKSYKRGAEFDDFTGLTLKSMLGRIKTNEASLDKLPTSLEYLKVNADGDGLSIYGSMENAAVNILKDKWCIAAVDYSGLASVDIEDISRADTKAMEVKPSIKLYSRASVVKSNFSVINGRNQLTFIMFYECGTVFNAETYSSETVESYLVLALDEQGYYQQKIVDGEEGLKDYVKINGESIKSIPMQILSDHEVDSELPKAFGFLSPIAEICMSRYNVSADYKWYMQKLAPTTNICMDSNFDSEAFSALNNGRSTYDHGGENFFSGTDTKIEVTSVTNNTQAYTEYMEDSEEKARSMGAVIPKMSNNATATEAVINVGEQNAVLRPLVNNLEQGYKWLIAYCGMFTGDVKQESLSEYSGDIELMMTREFTEPLLDHNQAKAITDLYMAGLKTKEGAVTMLKELGWETGEIEGVLSKLVDAV